MNSTDQWRRKNTGAVVLIALMLMIILTTMGFLATMIMITERNTSRNYRVAKEAFYVADGGYPVAVKVIEGIIHGDMASCSGLVLDNNLVNEIMGFYRGDKLLNDGESDSPRHFPDITTTILTHTLTVDIDRSETSLLLGGSVAFGSGGEGIGMGGERCKKVLFEICSQGQMGNDAQSKVVTVYRIVF